MPGALDSVSGEEVTHGLFPGRARRDQKWRAFPGSRDLGPWFQLGWERILDFGNGRRGPAMLATDVREIMIYLDNVIAALRDRGVAVETGFVGANRQAGRSITILLGDGPSSLSFA